MSPALTCYLGNTTIEGDTAAYFLCCLGNRLYGVENDSNIITCIFLIEFYVGGPSDEVGSFVATQK